jgi:hypothetical protein
MQRRNEMYIYSKIEGACVGIYTHDLNKITRTTIYTGLIYGQEGFSSPAAVYYYSDFWQATHTHTHNAQV